MMDASDQQFENFLKWYWKPACAEPRSDVFYKVTDIFMQDEDGFVECDEVR